MERFACPACEPFLAKFPLRHYSSNGTITVALEHHCDGGAGMLSGLTAVRSQPYLIPGSGPCSQNLCKPRQLELVLEWLPRRDVSNSQTVLRGRLPTPSLLSGCWVLSSLPGADVWGRTAVPTQLLTLPFLSPFWQAEGEGDLVSEASAWRVYQASSSVEGEAQTGLPVSCQTQEMVFNLHLTHTAGAKLDLWLFLPWPNSTPLSFSLSPRCWLLTFLHRHPCIHWVF